MKKIYFIGIGGIGVSALARFYLKKGWEVSGSDLIASEITEELKNLGAKIFTPHHPAKAGGTGQVGHSAKNLPKNVDLLIYSPAVPKDNPELVAAKKLGVKCQSYPQALGQLTKKYFTIAVSGTHGKSTTVALLSLILIKAGLDPTVIVGTKVREFGDSNCRVGKSPKGSRRGGTYGALYQEKSLVRGGARKYLVIEADEWQAGFLNYFPKIIVLTNIEKEHLDYYKNLNHILSTYKKYIKRLPPKGILIANKDDKNIYQLIKNNKKPTIFYSFKQKEIKKIKKILKIPGQHNIYNALSALTVARSLKIPDKISFQALAEYRGAWRRFEISIKYLNTEPYTLINDYAHHPTEIKATLTAAREKFGKHKIWAIFQPHQYQRTYYFFNEFVKAFDLADEIILTNIYDVAGRETKKISKKVSAKKLAERIKKRGLSCHFIGNFKKIPQFLKKRVKSGDILLIMGAGNIYKLADFL